MHSETPIFDRVSQRRNIDIAKSRKQDLIKYITAFIPDYQKLEKKNVTALKNIAEDIRDWNSFPSEYPSDDDLLLFRRVSF